MEQYQKYISMVLDNRYSVNKLLGSGGMSYVFLGFDSVMKRDVAIKILREELLSDEDALKRFENEATALSMLSHENITKCFDVSKGPELKYIVLEYTDGYTLKDHITKSGVLSTAEVMRLSSAILEALAYAHSKNIIHRDIKPQNILLNADGRIKLSDFGIAKVPDGDPLPISCKTVGTVDYISPEQAKGKGIDCRSDIYSLGIMMYEMVTGVLPFVSDNPMDVAYMHISDIPKEPSKLNPKLPKGLEQIILRAIRKNPDERFDSARQMLDCLKRLKDNPDATFDFVTFDLTDPTTVHKDSGDLLFSGSYLPDSDSDFKSVSIGQPKILRGRARRKKDKKKIKKTVIREKVIIKKTAHVSMASMLLGILCAMGIIALTALLYVYENYFNSIISVDKDAQVVVIPDFEGQIYNNELSEQLKNAGYDVTIEYVTGSDKLYSTVVSQFPKKNSRRNIVPGEQLCELTLYLSSGEDMFMLENYVGLEYREASIGMSQSKLNVVFEKIYSDTMPQGRIISTYPAGGALITLDTVVKVYVSKGPDVSYTTVPSLVGYDMNTATQKIQDSGLILGKVTYQKSTTVPAGRVISQNLFRGETVAAGVTRIDLVVSGGI